MCNYPNAVFWLWLIKYWNGSSPRGWKTPAMFKLRVQLGAQPHACVSDTCLVGKWTSVLVYRGSSYLGLQQGPGPEPGPAQGLSLFQGGFFCFFWPHGDSNRCLINKVKLRRPGCFRTCVCAPGFLCCLCEAGERERLVDLLLIPSVVSAVARL